MGAPDYALMWLDLETTGLDPDLDGILEIAWQYTDQQIEPFGEMQSAYVQPGPAAISRWYGNDFVRDMHEASGLKAAWESAKLRSPHLLDVEIAADIDAYIGPERTVRIAGSGVSHFDMAFLRRHMPALHARLDWRPMDIGQIEEWAELGGWIPPYEAPEGGPAKTHRAADDIRYHQAEAAYYLAWLRGECPVSNPGPLPSPDDVRGILR